MQKESWKTIHNQDNNQSINTDADLTQILRLAEKGYLENCYSNCILYVQKVRDIECIQENQIEAREKTTVPELKYILYGINSRLDLQKERLEKMKS